MSGRRPLKTGITRAMRAKAAEDRYRLILSMEIGSKRLAKALGLHLSTARNVLERARFARELGRI